MGGQNQEEGFFTGEGEVQKLKKGEGLQKTEPWCVCVRVCVHVCVHVRVCTQWTVHKDIITITLHRHSNLFT